MSLFEFFFFFLPKKAFSAETKSEVCILPQEQQYKARFCGPWVCKGGLTGA